MSEVAGRMSVQVGAQYLEKPNGGRGILLGGVPGVAPANAVILAAAWWEPTPPRWRSDWERTSPSSNRNLNRLRDLDDIFNGRW